MNHFGTTGVLALTCMVAAAHGPTKAQAEALVQQAVAFGKQNGMAKLIQETNEPTGRFHVGSGSEPYIFIYDQGGHCKAIGFNTSLSVGKIRTDLLDRDGRPIVFEAIKAAKISGKTWYRYKLQDSATSQIKVRTEYLELCNDLIIGVDILDENPGPDPIYEDDDGF